MGDDPHGDDVVTIALIINLIDAVLKFIAAGITGSASLFAEGVHTSIDTLNQAILYYGIKAAQRSPNPKFPYGYGNIRYVTALMAGCGIFFLGSGLSIYHGIEGLLDPKQLEPSIMAYVALGVSGLFSAISAIQATYKVIKLSRKAKVSFMNFVLSGVPPSLNVVLFEDTAAVIGVIIAAIGYTVSRYIGKTWPDSIGSILVGILLAFVAVIVIRTNSRALLGKALPQKVTNNIVSVMQKDPIEVKEFKDERQLEEFMLKHGEGIIDQEASEIDRIEMIIRKYHPNVQYVDIEPL